jgi:hypothetical protein
MERSISDRSILDKFCTEFCAVVEKYAQYIIVSGFLAIAAGRTRATEDIDMIVERMDKAAFERLHHDLVTHSFVCMQSDSPDVIYYDYLTKKASVRYTYRDQHVPEMEIKFAKDALDTLQLKNRMKIPQTGLDVWFGTPEMTIAYKEDYLKSDKDMEDAKHLRIVFDAEERKINECKKLIRMYR